MKATINIATREVVLEYFINKSDCLVLTQQERNDLFNDWSTYQKNTNSKIKCKHSIRFSDLDEWKSTILFDGRTIDFHYDYINRKEIDSKSEWLSYIFQGYEAVEGKPQLYDYNVVKKVIIEY